MARLGPWERSPRLAVAVSGGPDSLALTLLADGWARARGGAVLALTVDHGLRPEAAAEAATVAAWLGARGIAHATLEWSGPRPMAAIQAAARAARLDLLAAACREAGILHLLLAHHRQDQAETASLRGARGSGTDGRAA
ncbi:MAG: tRNA lysidine(34) synthetase TilS, partial [Alphaproteobacteria bacterium]